MPMPYDIAVQALQAESARVRALSQNLVNAASTGYKRELTATGFAQALAGGSAALPGAQATTAAAMTDFRQGMLRHTGEPAHLALDGPGFFEVRLGSSVLYTRAGGFTRDTTGRLVDAQGHALQAANGDLVLRGTTFRVERDGTVLEDGQPVARLRVVDFADRSVLRRAGAASFSGGDARPVATVAVRQGELETSNVTTSHEMVQLMEAVKRFEFGHRVVQTQDDLLEKAVRRLSEN
jgi:flagellar basal-body rod protein FlgF